MLAFKGKINTRPNNRKLKIYVPIIEHCIQIESKKRPSADRILEYLAKVAENSNGSSDEDTFDDGSESPETETFDRYSPLSSAALKALCEQKPNMKRLNIVKQVHVIM